MNTYTSLIVFLLISLYSTAQNSVILRNRTDSASVTLRDSTLIIRLDGKEYLSIPRNKTLYLSDDAAAWDDLRVPVTSTTAAGSNPPAFAMFRNNGGKFLGMARLYDGDNDYDSIPASPLLNFSRTDFSIAFWMQPSPGIQDDAKILYKKNGWNIGVQNKRLRVYIEGNPVFISPTELNIGARNFVVVAVRNKSTNASLTIYVNNLISGQLALNAPVNDATTPVYIGKAESKGLGNAYAGVLDELFFWNRLLTISEQDSLWNESKGTTHRVGVSSLVAGFTFDQVNGKYFSSVVINSPIQLWSSLNASAPLQVTGLLTENPISHGVFAYFFDQDQPQELFFAAQLPHTWVEGTNIEPHVHFVRPSGEKGTIVWGLEYTWSNTGENYGETQILYTKDTGGNLGDQDYASFGFIDGKGKKISSMLVCRIFRDASCPDDTYPDDACLLEVDFHIRNNSLGSAGIKK